MSPGKTHVHRIRLSIDGLKRFPTDGTPVRCGVPVPDRLIGGERPRRALVRLMDALTTPKGLAKLETGDNYIRHKIWEGLAQAYLITGRKKFVRAGLKDMGTLRLCSLYRRLDPILRMPRDVVAYEAPGGPARPESFVGTGSVAYRLAKIPYFLFAARQAGLRK